MNPQLLAIIIIALLIGIAFFKAIAREPPIKPTPNITNLFIISSAYRIALQ